LDVQRLQESFARMAMHGDAVPLFFYSDLFLRHPEVRDLFPVSMAAQRDRLVHALGRIVADVEHVDALGGYLQGLGREHRKFGAIAEYYPYVGASLVATVAHFNGPAWTPELAADWKAAYDLVAQVMTRAAAEDAGTRPAFWEATVIAHELRRFDIAAFRVATTEPLSYLPGQSVSVESSERRDPGPGAGQQQRRGGPAGQVEALAGGDAEAEPGARRGTREPAAHRPALVHPHMELQPVPWHLGRQVRDRVRADHPVAAQRHMLAGPESQRPERAQPDHQHVGGRAFAAQQRRGRDHVAGRRGDRQVGDRPGEAGQEVTAGPQRGLQAAPARLTGVAALRAQQTGAACSGPARGRQLHTVPRQALQHRLPRP
jgi:hemoglobin-like flavoprotein